MSQPYIWLFIIIMLIIIEAASINLTSIWFVASGLIALILSFFTDNFLVEFGVFVVVGVILMVFTRPILLKFVKTKHEKTNLDRIVGMSGLVIEEITDNDNGAVKVDGKVWTAYASNPISKGSKVKVLEIEGTKIKVEELKD